MVDAIIIIICIVAAINIGFDSLQLLPEDILMQVSNISALRFTLAGFASIIGLGIGVAVQTTYRRLEKQVSRTPIEVIITRAIGLAIGLLIANLMLAPMFLLPIPNELSFVKPAIAIMGSVMFSYMGISLADTHGRTFLRLINPGSLESILAERIIIRDTNYEDLDTVDAKLVLLTQEINGILLTNDYNLSKVANVQGVSVLNVNDLAQSLRPLYLPGDNLDLKIIKQGKEPQQGIGYLDDGTMVVVDEGHRYVGGEIQVVVTSSLQTSAGRMIFAKPGTEMIIEH